MDDKPIKIVTIGCSPKETGHTASLLKLFTETAITSGAKIERFDLYEEHIKPFSGELGKKIKKLDHIQRALIESDGFVIATPTYWFNEPGILKNFVDNLTPLEENGFLLEGKVAGILVYSPEGGETTVLETLALTFNQMGVAIPPYALIFFRGPADKWALKDASMLARSIINEVKIQRQMLKSKAYITSGQ